MTTPPPKKPGTWVSLARAFTSWRTASVTLMSFSSGMPLGLVWIAIPDWMRDIGVDIRVVGLHHPGAGAVDVQVPVVAAHGPLRAAEARAAARLGSSSPRSLLFIFTLMLAGVGDHPDTPWVVAALALAIAFAGASQDIAIDAYAVDVLRPEEQAIAVGARNALYRVGMIRSPAASRSPSPGKYGWPAVNVFLACLYLPMLLVTWKAPEPPRHRGVAPTTLKEAVWYPVPGLPRPPPRPGDPRLRPALQARRPASPSRSSGRS